MSELRNVLEETLGHTHGPRYGNVCKGAWGPLPSRPSSYPAPAIADCPVAFFFFFFFKLAFCGPLTLPATKARRISCFVPHHTPSAWKVLVNTCE